MELVQNIFNYLNSNCNYAVLRNYKGLPEEIKSRDIDILISKKDLSKNKSEIVSIIISANFKIATYFKSDRMMTFVCSSITNGKIEIIQFDFLIQTSLHGLIIFDSDKILDAKVFDGKVYHVSKEYEFLDKYLYLKFLNISYPVKYNSLRKEIEKSESLNRILKETIGCSSLEETEKLSSAILKRRRLLINIKERPLQQIQVYGLFFVRYLKNFIKYKGYSLGFTGPDGAGKTTVINEVINELEKTYSGIQLLHFRPSITPNLGEAAHKVKLKTVIDIDYSNPHRGEKTGILSSFLRLTYYSIDYIFGYIIRIRPFLHKRCLVIFDRYYTDIIADSRRSKIFINHKFLFYFNKLFIPKLDYNILLTADRDIILSRKQELTAEGIDDINKKLNYLSTKKGYYLVMNNATPKDAVLKILTIIFDEQHKKNMKRI